MIAVILNPQSGAVAEIEEIIRRIEESLPGARVFVGHAAGDARRQTEEAAANGFTTIVAAGGDGTLNEVLNGLLPHADRIRLGLLPLGTGNDFARVLPLKADIDLALVALQEGHTRRFDVVRVNGGEKMHHFLNVSAGGFSGTVSEKMTSDLKAAWGPLSYVRGMLGSLNELAPYACELTLDDAPPIPLSAYNLVVANAQFVARGIPIAPKADPADGLLDVIAIRETSGARLALLAPLVLTGHHLENEDVFFRQARKITVRATPAMPFNADGELIGDSPLTFEILPQAVTMIVPAPAPE